MGFSDSRHEKINFSEVTYSRLSETRTHTHWLAETRTRQRLGETLLRGTYLGWLCAGMIGLMDSHQARVFNMRVDLRCLDTGVSQHLLN